MQPLPHAPKLDVLDSFEELSQLLVESQLEDEVFYTLPWFENLAKHGLASTEVPLTLLLLVASEVTPGSAAHYVPTVCLPFAAGHHLALWSGSPQDRPRGWHWHSTCASIQAAGQLSP